MQSLLESNYMEQNLQTGNLPSQGEESDIITLKTPEQVAQVAAELPKITKEWFREHYYKIDEEDYGFPLDEEDFEYTWYWFCDSLPFWERATREKKYVLFTADQ